MLKLLLVSFCKPVVHKVKMLGGRGGRGNLNIINQLGQPQKKGVGGTKFWNFRGDEAKLGETRFLIQIYWGKRILKETMYLFFLLELR